MGGKRKGKVQRLSQRREEEIIFQVRHEKRSKSKFVFKKVRKRKTPQTTRTSKRKKNKRPRSQDGSETGRRKDEGASRPTASYGPTPLTAQPSPRPINKRDVAGMQMPSNQLRIPLNIYTFTMLGAPTAQLLQATRRRGGEREAERRRGGGGGGEEEAESRVRRCRR